MLSASSADPSPVEESTSVGIAITSERVEADALSEWPPLTNVADVEVLYDRTIDWLEYEHPQELSDVPVGTPEEAVRLVKESLLRERYRAPSVTSDRKNSWRNSFEPPSPSSSSLGSSAASRRHHSISHASQISSSPSEGSNASTKSIPGYTVKMGPLGWIIVPDKSENVPKKSKSTREGGLKKFLKDRNKSGECASCLNSLSTRYMVPLRCQHRYCQPCFGKLVQISMKHENIFPPKCCLEEIPTKTIFSNVSRALVQEYKLKEEEYSTLVSSRWYCPSKSCAKWIPPTKLTRSCDTQRCPHCFIIICATCRDLTHGKKESCSQDFGSRAAPNLEEASYSRRCNRCQSMVELRTGSQIVACACSAQFCAICTSPLQLCSCTEIDVARWQEGHRSRRRNLSQSTNDPSHSISSTRFTRHASMQVPERSQEYTQNAKEGRKTPHIVDEKRILEINKKVQFLKTVLSQISKSQQTALISRHRREGQDLENQVSSSQGVFDKQCNRLTATLEANLKARRALMDTEHASELDKMKASHEEEEDETFINLCRYLKNKPNREAREAGIIEKLKVAHEEELAALEEKHRAAARELEYNGSLELKGLRSGIDFQRQEEQQKERDAVITFSRTVNVERSWFDAAVKKRNQMLDQLRTDLLDGELGVRGPVSPPRDSAVELPANEPVIVPGGGPNWEGSELEGDVPIRSKFGSMALC